MIIKDSRSSGCPLFDTDIIIGLETEVMRRYNHYRSYIAVHGGMYEIACIKNQR
jgi:hypothetical protein